MSRIQTFEDAIVTALGNAFVAPKPYITADMNYEDAGDELKIRQRAKLKASSKYGGGAIFVGYIGKDFGDGNATGGLQVYKPFYKFAILMFAQNRRKTSTAHIDIYDIIETTEEALYKLGYRLYSDDNTPVKIDQTGLYRSALIVGNYKPYPYQKLTPR